MSNDGVEQFALFLFSDESLAGEHVQALLADAEEEGECETIVHFERPFGHGASYPLKLKQLDQLVSLPWNVDVTEDWELELEDIALRALDNADVESSSARLREFLDDPQEAAGRIVAVTKDSEDIDVVVEILASRGDAAPEDGASGRLAHVVAHLANALESASEQGLSVAMLHVEQGS